MTAADQMHFDFSKLTAASADSHDRDGSMDFDLKIRNLLNRAIKKSPHDRIDIASRMTRLIFGDAGDNEVTKAQIDSWTGPSRTDWRFPLSYLPAFIEVTGGYFILSEIAEILGCKLLVGEQCVLALVGAAILTQKQARKDLAALEKNIPQDVLARLTAQLNGTWS